MTSSLVKEIKNNMEFFLPCNLMLIPCFCSRYETFIYLVQTSYWLKVLFFKS